MKTGKIANTFRVDSGKHFKLKDFDPADTGHWHSKEHAAEALQEGILRTAALQDKLYAQDRWALLLIFQALDAAGKDGAIEHVMSGVNPQGCQVYSFKTPSERELQHDFLWRTRRELRERDRACHVGGESAGVPGVFVQDAFGTGTAARFPLAHHARFARTRPHRNL